MRRSKRGKEPEYKLDPEIERSCNLRNRVLLLIARNDYLEERSEAMHNGVNNPRNPEDPPVDEGNGQSAAVVPARRSCRNYMIMWSWRPPCQMWKLKISS
ncbi:hypothetical protein HRI_001490700 [Hibiscus trionum]|uniref:Uncharacterized protein n=1 Tax=Hibiscus trionum TaxID=183268 RepID=A0A9W7LUZ7_HIBTR|nr:hypothetical protein HRI_001490700 [Hibiscus trionum]